MNRLSLFLYLQMKVANLVAGKFYPQALSIYGNWLADTRSENPNVIMEKYLEKVRQTVIICFRKRINKKENVTVWCLCMAKI